jgi:glycosyltransferase involved in cell wall biosynthesis
MLPDVIRSFWAQDFADAELVVQDNASTDETEALVQGVATLDSRVVYARNERNLGVAENIRRALDSARGSYVVLLGDDDILLGPQALGTYAAVFEANSDVHFAYPNQIQMDRDMKFDIVYRHFHEGAKFAAGGPSLRNTWLKSVQIAGLALRRSDELSELFPRSTMLFPQVELVGRLLLRHASYGIPEFLVGVRSHGDQLGFHANRRSRVVGPERHGTIEIIDVAARISPQVDASWLVDYAATEMARSLAFILPNERVNGSARIVVSNVVRLMRKSNVARRYPLLVLSLVISAATPPKLLDWARRSAKRLLRRRDVLTRDWFEAELDRQRALAFAPMSNNR